MRRRALVLGFMGALTMGGLARPSASRAQTGQRRGPPVVGFIGGSPPTPATQRFWQEFEEGLRAHGLAPGKDVLIDYRYFEGNPEPLRRIADEFVQAGVALIVAPSTQAALAAQHATATIPIVTVFAGDPVGSGLAESLARPGRNVTGTTSQGVDFATKHFQLLAEAAPQATRFAVLFTPGNPPHERGLRQIQAAASGRAIAVLPVAKQASGEVEPAFAVMAGQKPDALIVFDDPTVWSNRRALIDLAIEHRLPTIFQGRLYAEQGGLVSFAPNPYALTRQATRYVADVLRGADPATLPIEQPTSFELVINLKTAKLLGLSIPAAVLARADEVIE